MTKTHFYKGKQKPFDCTVLCRRLIDWLSGDHTDIIEDVTCKSCIKSLDRRVK